MMNYHGDSGHVDDACGGSDDDDWSCNQRKWLIIKVVSMIVLIIVMMIKFNIDINDDYYAYE